MYVKGKKELGKGGWMKKKRGGLPLYMGSYSKRKEHNHVEIGTNTEREERTKGL